MDPAAHIEQLILLSHVYDPVVQVVMEKFVV